MDKPYKPAGLQLWDSNINRIYFFFFTNTTVTFMLSVVLIQIKQIVFTIAKLWCLDDKKQWIHIKVTNAATTNIVTDK